ncbi:Plasma membrane fusion protein PRM1 [Hypsizygus marmoreus]|uniref:Plasma membrane fusion protein PRM1 n=1 Tax=Hypsizygus marmoreus TaxID=39966 RepID=A0A369J3U5_HYPMA|nr:Plasma membrane fusion protein PRM1 [Hypsizygus marmoreus]
MSVASHWNAPPPTYETHSYMSSTLTPYLQLPHLLSLTWLAYPILSLAFVAFRLQLSLTSAQDAVASAKTNLLASCKAAERAATSAASMPRFLAIASNEQFADAVNGSLNAARAALVFALTVMEAIINFIIDLYRSTLLCFLELVVRGGLAILIGAVNELNDIIKNVTSGLRTSIQNDIASANSVIAGAIDGINKINPFNDITAPQIPVPNLDGLQNIALPPSFEQALTNLNSSLPTVDDLKNKIESIIDTPFELLKKDINDTFGAISFNSSTLPVPKQNLLTFCNDMDLSVVDDVGHDLIKVAKIGVIILIILALLLIGLNCLLEWYKWRCMKAHLEYTRQAWMSDPTMVHAKPTIGAPSVTLSDHNLMLLNANSSHPLLTRISNNMSKLLRLSPSQHTHLQWFFNYVFHPPALACLLIGLIGLLSIQLQLAAMGPIIAKYQERSAGAASGFSNTIATSINASMYDQSAAYASDVNGRVDAIQTTINQGVFGWVNVTTVTLNTTIVNFYDDVQNAVGTVFDGTILQTPAREFIRCLIGTKVNAIENALTFLHDNLIVNIPRVNDTVLVLSPEHVNEATTPIAQAAIGGGDDGKEGLIERIVNSYAESLRKERLMFGIFIALWGFVVLMALCVIFWHSYGKRLVERRKRRRWEREQRAGIDGIVVPFRMDPPPQEKRVVGLHDDLPSFTPLPSPKGSAFKPFSFSRSASPAMSVAAEPNEHRDAGGWGAAFRQKFTAGQPAKLKAIGRKAMGKEQFIADQEDRATTTNDSGKRNTAWFGRVATMLDKRQSRPDPEAARPRLRISINPPSLQDSTPRAPSSRWSASPTATEEVSSSPWKNLRKKTPPPLNVSPRPKPRHTPMSVGSTYEASALMAPLQPTPFAPPIHHGFDDSRYPPPPTHPSHQVPIPTTTIKSPRSPKLYPSQQTLAPPVPQRHRRTSSVPTTPSASESESVTPVTRLLTTMHARKSSSVDPFVTPFDDEYRVTIAQNTHARKSIPTNPFVVAM